MEGHLAIDSVYEYVVLDVFTRVPLQGNPLAVFVDSAGLDGHTMQRAARELNLSETVFLGPSERADATARIFTPRAELPFAGHPVLGSAFVIAVRTGKLDVRLATGAGVVPVRLRGEPGQPVSGEMDQPLPVAEPFHREPELLGALGVQGSVMPVGAYRNGPLHVFVALPDTAALAALEPDLSALCQLGEVDVACFAVAEDHVESRNFVPGLGVPEDPATGSAAGPLALHLIHHGSLRYGEDIVIHQGVAMDRPSCLRARVDGGGRGVERVKVSGEAVLVAEGRYRLR